MTRVYVVVPAAMMLAFIAYFAWGAPRSTTFRFVGEAPQGWEGRPPASAARPAVTATSGDEYEGRDGTVEALNDLLAGKVVLLGYGLPYLWQAELTEIWKRDFDVEAKDIAGCLVTEPLVRYVTNYNRVMYAHLADRFGPDVSAEVSRKAAALYADRYPERVNAK